jgi:hypothetical protein
LLHLIGVLSGVAGLSLHRFKPLLQPLQPAPLVCRALLSTVGSGFGSPTIGIGRIGPLFCSIGPLFCLFGPLFGQSYPLIGRLKKSNEACDFCRVFGRPFGRMFARTFAGTNFGTSRHQHEGSALVVRLGPPSHSASAHPNRIR